MTKIEKQTDHEIAKNTIESLIRELTKELPRADALRFQEGGVSPYTLPHRRLKRQYPRGTGRRRSIGVESHCAPAAITERPARRCGCRGTRNTYRSKNSGSKIIGRQDWRSCRPLDPDSRGAEGASMKL